MPLHDHGSTAPTTHDSPETSTRNARYGLILFAVYLALYGAFVGINAFAPQVMERKIAGVNLAIWYGFGLIAAAFMLALVYGWLCRAPAPAPHAPERRA
jgi:uncharacterized membrane protein (DUF485 family)